MKTTVNHTSDTHVEVTISLDSAELANAEQVALSRLSKTTKVPGFREGKTPLSMVAKHVDPQQLQEKILDTAISKAVADAFLSENLQAIERPSVEVIKYVPGDVLECKAEADILPKVTLGDYKSLTAKPEVAEVSDDDVNEVIERMQQGFAEKKTVDRKAQEGDDVIIDFEGKKNGVAFDGGTAKDFTLKLGSGQFIPGFEEGLIGHKAGETIDVELTFPADYHAEELAGEKVVFTTTLKEVQEATLPELNDELAKKAGPFETFDDLKKDIRREIAANKDREAQEQLKNALIDELVAKSKVIAPEKMVDDAARSIEQDFAQNLLYRGLTLENYLRTNKFKDEDDWRKKEVRPAAERRVKSSLVLNELSRVEKITITDNELEEHVELHKKQYANNPEVLKQLEADEARADIANHYVIEKAIARLIELN
ncbi:trigger factor [Candidatus Saccharibacteria bacterium]|nr:trigger factor [Candidatus Saccharibacteria bacterium]